MPPAFHSMPSLSAHRFSRELGSFRQWCEIADRAMKESGVPADEVEERVTAHRRPTTRIFIQHGWHGRPMSVPPFRVSGSSADAGGEASALRGAGLSGQQQQPTAAAPAAAAVADDGDGDDAEEFEQPGALPRMCPPHPLAIPCRAPHALPLRVAQVQRPVAREMKTTEPILGRSLHLRPRRRRRGRRRRRLRRHPPQPPPLPQHPPLHAPSRDRLANRRSPSPSRCGLVEVVGAAAEPGLLLLLCRAMPSQTRSTI